MILDYSSNKVYFVAWALLAVTGAALMALLGFHRVKALLKHIYSVDLPQEVVKLIQATARVFRVALGGERSEEDLAENHLVIL
jgi:hypothetical protein